MIVIRFTNIDSPAGMRGRTFEAESVHVYGDGMYLGPEMPLFATRDRIRRWYLVAEPDGESWTEYSVKAKTT